MAKRLGMRCYGDTVLRAKSERVSPTETELEPLFGDMVETMRAERGVGLAGPQVGVSKRIAIMNPEPENEKTLIKMANPRIVAASDELETLDEGCLSVPGIRGEVARHVWIEVAYEDEKGVERKLRAEGLLARIVQHELDHLDGVLFIDRLSLAKRALIKPKLKGLAGGKET
jgi:peptide deformylase